MRKHTTVKLVNIFFLLVLFIIINAFDFQDNPPSGWYQQFLPNINGRQIVDITFLDSLTGYIVTTRLASPDTSYVLKTTDGGDNWNINYVATGLILKSVHFINQNVGFVAGSLMLKTTNAGLNWSAVAIPTPADEISIINTDTLWYIYSESLTGGVYRTTNGGGNWLRQASFGSSNPDRIYMFNANIGFISYSAIAASPTRKTTRNN